MKEYILQRATDGKYLMNPRSYNGWQHLTPDISEARVLSKKEVKAATYKLAYTVIRLRIYRTEASIDGAVIQD